MLKLIHLLYLDGPLYACTCKKSKKNEIYGVRAMVVDGMGQGVLCRGLFGQIWG